MDKQSTLDDSKELIDSLKQIRGYDASSAHAWAFGAAWALLTKSQRKQIIKMVKKNWSK